MCEYAHLGLGLLVLLIYRSDSVETVGLQCAPGFLRGALPGGSRAASFTALKISQRPRRLFDAIARLKFPVEALTVSWRLIHPCSAMLGNS